MTDLSSLTNEQLVSYFKECSNNVTKFDKAQHATKILINSLYGCLGTPYFRMYDLYQAEGITLSGQAVITHSYDTFNKFINDKLNTKKDFVVASDTDSGYVNLTDLAKNIFETYDIPEDKQVDTIVQLCDTVISKKLTKAFDEFAADTNAWSNRIDMKREAVASAVFVAKKNYVMNVYDNEGTRYAKPKQKITGLEAIKSSTPLYFRDKLKEGYSHAFYGTAESFEKFVSDVYSEYSSLPIASIAATTSVSEINKYLEGSSFKSGTPFNVKAAHNYNTLIVKHGLTDKYKKIQPGDKIKIINLKTPNPLKHGYFAYLDTFPEEFIDAKYIDRETNYEKFFLTPIMRVFSILNWKHDSSDSLDDFFV